MSTYSNQKKIEENLNLIFKNKGIVGSVAEKAMNNYQQKKQSRKDAASNQQLHYFCIGHKFKNIDTNEIFKFDSDNKPTRFKILYKDSFNFRIDPNLFFGNTIPERDLDIKNDFLFYLIDAVRNINGHFIHEFDVIRYNDNDNPIKKSVIPFLKESFMLALVLAYQKREIQKNDGKIEKKKNEIPTVEFLLNNLDSVILPFAKEVFYQSLYTQTKVSGKFIERTLNDYQKGIKNYIDLHFDKLNNFVDFLLFNDIQEKVDWELNPSEQKPHQILQIQNGKYLSFNGCLFLLSLFLYKNEANKLIPKISGFKKNGNADDQAKINIFTAFSKKFSSQDIHHEDQNLVNFRDIIQYLNKYPVAWKPYLEFDENKDKITDKNLVERDYPTSMINPLKEKIEIQEIYKYFPYVFSYYDVLCEKDGQNKTKYQNLKTAFLQYAINKLFRKSKQNENKLFDHFIEKNIEFQHIYFRVLLNQAEPNNKQYQINKYTFAGNTGGFKNKTLNYIIYNKFIKTAAFDSWNGRNRANKKFFKDFDVNKKTDKLKRRIEEKTIYTSNCRNQDRFLLFAIRYLAETNYFGEDAQFKMYEFYDMKEQNDHIKILSKKEKDELKYDGGKTVCFKTYKEHLEKYGDWEMPFLVENNAVFIKITGQDRVIALQKNIIVYFLEDALKGNKDGAKFLNDFIEFKHNKYKEYKEILLNNETITDIQKTDLLKVFPKRLLHLYNVAKQNNLPEFTAFELVLRKAEYMEERYNKLKDQAEANGKLDFFEKKNKGRQFKLQFIRKAWNVMYFREAYFETTKEKGGHHKVNNISKQEINDFSKWMFLFYGDDVYKQKLQTLFDSKNFFKNEEFKELFNASINLDDFYERTKIQFLKFSITPKQKNNNQKEVLNDYINNHLEIGNIYLNHTLFKEYISNNSTSIEVENKRIQYFFVTRIEEGEDKGNKQYLLDEYYYKAKIDHSEPKAHKHLFAKLNTNRLEDCLLYEIAFKYLNKENNQLKAKVDEVLSRDITFTVSKQNVNNTAYNLVIPFNKVDRFFELKATGNDNFNILSNLKKYLENVAAKTRYDDKYNKSYDKEIINLSHDFKKSNTLKLEDVNKVNNHIINSSVRFTKCVMALEEYFIWKHELVITKKNFIDLTEITELYCDKRQPTGKYFNESVDVKKEIRNKALHFNLPSTDKSYYDVLKGFEKVFVTNEVESKLNNSLDEKGKMPEKVLENFMLSIHDKDTYMKRNFHEAKKARIIELTHKHKEEFVYKSNKTFRNAQDLEKDKVKQLNNFIEDKYWAKEENKVKKLKSIEEYIKIVNAML